MAQFMRCGIGKHVSKIAIVAPLSAEGGLQGCIPYAADLISQQQMQSGCLDHIPAVPSEPTAPSMWATDKKRSHIFSIRCADSRTFS